MPDPALARFLGPDENLRQTDKSPFRGQGAAHSGKLAAFSRMTLAV
jgi:hypothetical protein